MNRYLLTLLILLFTFPQATLAQSNSVPSSPKQGWGNFKVVEKEEPTVLTQILLWLPNRVADFIDIFRADVGVGPATGGVVRVTKHFQVGYRNVHPLSARVGLFGSDYPFLLESSSEFGVSPAYIESKDRNVCNSEIGVGLDLFIIGGYGGICLQETADFIAGLFLIDLNDDDWE